jgi:hypothetical protein
MCSALMNVLVSRLHSKWANINNAIIKTTENMRRELVLGAMTSTQNKKRVALFHNLKSVSLQFPGVIITTFRFRHVQRYRYYYASAASGCHENKKPNSGVFFQTLRPQSDSNMSLFRRCRPDKGGRCVSNPQVASFPRLGIV